MRFEKLLKTAAPFRALAVIIVAGFLTLDCVVTCVQGGQKPALKTRNVLLVTIDGLRWQEVFGGAEPALIDKEAGGVKNPAEIRERYLRNSVVEQRTVLMPFFWNTLAQQGTVFGNPDTKSTAVVTNKMNFSYPGYSEILCGFQDPKIDSNAKKNNANVTVLEWVAKKPGFENSVAAVCSWDVFPFIINEERSGLPVNAGWEPLATDASLRLVGTAAEAELRSVDELSLEYPRSFPDVRYDYVTFRGAEEYIRTHKPRLMYVALGEPDDWAHAGRYDLYLDATRRTDDYIRRLWEMIQSMPEYRDCTSLVLTTDHGRGGDRVEWKSHGEKIAGSEHIWIAVLGPDTKTQMVEGSEVTQSQIASTVATLLGLDYVAEVPQAGASLPILNRE